MDPGTKDQILHSVGMFANIDYLLFTHSHEDHYDSKNVISYLKANPTVKLIVSEGALPDKELQDLQDSSNSRIFFLERGKSLHEFSSGSTKISFFRTKHLEYQIKECDDHYSIQIEDEKKKIFIAGDLELNAEETEKLFQNNSFDAVFFNPMVLYKPDWINNYLSVNASRKYIYHIPSEANDRFFYRKITLHHYNLLKEKLQNSQLLMDEMQKISL
jgi:hypothetical protein